MVSPVTNQSATVDNRLVSVYKNGIDCIDFVSRLQICSTRKTIIQKEDTNIANGFSKTFGGLQKAFLNFENELIEVSSYFGLFRAIWLKCHIVFP